MPDTNLYTKASPALVRIGDDGSHAGTAANPTLVQDVFCRVGGPDGTVASPVAVDTMVEVNRWVGTLCPTARAPLLLLLLLLL